MEMMNSLSLKVLQLVTNRSKDLIGSPQQGTDENSTNSGELISASAIAHHSGFNSPRSITIPEVSSSAATINKEERDMISTVLRRKEFIHIERVKGKPTNVVQGLELYDGIFNPKKQEEIVEAIYELQQKGKNGKFKAFRTYSETARWLRSKDGSTMQFGSNYAEDRKGNPPGILTNEVVDPLPPCLEDMIQKLMDFNILPTDRKPDNCVVNIYNIGDCLPPDTYHTDFLCPSCTVSLVTQCNILFGVNNKKGTTEISAPVHIHLPAGSVLVLNGNAANLAKQSVPHMTGKRISITFRKMDESKLLLKKSLETGFMSESASRTGSLPQDSLQHQARSTMSDNGSETGEDSEEELTTEKDDSPLSSNSSSYSSLSSASL